MVKPTNPFTARFQVLFRKAGVHEKDVECFPMWLEKYGQFLEHAGYSELIVERDVVISFLRSLLQSGVPAWQRLQAARAIRWFESRILKSPTSKLDGIESRLAEAVKAEAARSGSGGRPEDFSARAAMMPGRINENDPLLIQSIRKELRTRHYAIRTESVYVGWAERM